MKFEQYADKMSQNLCFEMCMKHDLQDDKMPHFQCMKYCSILYHPVAVNVQEICTFQALGHSNITRHVIHNSYNNPVLRNFNFLPVTAVVELSYALYGDDDYCAG